MIAQWLRGRVLDSRPRGRGFKPHRHHCLVSLSKNINPSLVQVQPRKTRPFIPERLLIGCKESNQTNKWPIFMLGWNSYGFPFKFCLIINSLREITGRPFILFSGDEYYELQYEISNNIVCATSKGSDQPAHMCRLIRAFASRLNIL